jgi:hypothetical protein
MSLTCVWAGILDSKKRLFVWQVYLPFHGSSSTFHVHCQLLFNACLESRQSFLNMQYFEAFALLFVSFLLPSLPLVGAEYDRRGFTTSVSTFNA